MTKSLLLSLLGFLVLATNLRCQGEANPFAEQEGALVKKATSLLTGFARKAKSKKHGPMERSAYELVIAEYDPDNKTVRRALDYEFDKDDEEWKLVPPKKRRDWPDKADRKGRFELDQEWRSTCEKLGVEHRTLGLEMMKAQGASLAEGADHLRRAILYNPFDKDAHEALGHEPWSDGTLEYYGDAEDVAFMGRMKEIETFALMLAKKNYDPQPVAEIPESLQRTGLEFYGARTKNFTVFVRGTQANADDVVQWGERALEFLEYATGGDKAVMRNATAQMKGWKWIGYLWTSLEMEKFKEMNPELVPDLRGKYANLIFQGKGGGTCQVATEGMPSYMHDHLIAHVFHYGLIQKGGANAGLLEGAHHAATWFLKSTCKTRYGAEPKGTEADSKKSLPEGANWWMREMRNQALARTDVPLDVVPRTELSKFPADVRLKSWSFSVWAMARFPEGWLKFLQLNPHDKIPFPQEVDEASQKAFGMPIAEVEKEWRDWASGRGVAAAATGYGPPLLPEYPEDEELDGLERLNAIRRLTSTFGEPAITIEDEDETTTLREGWVNALGECELDSEATAACEDHARFLGKHEEHWVWPEAHEEDPAKEGFTPRGMRAGLRSVIVFSQGSLDAVSAVDQWIGTVYHRFPLLEYNINRFGLAYDNTGLCEVIVLDSGSLQEPRDPVRERQVGYIAWPPLGMTNVPRQFAYTEHPNPLEDVGLEFEDQKDTGYPVSLQFSHTVAQRLGDVSMKLYTAKKRGKDYEPDEEVPCWLHTPSEPLLKRLALSDVVFVIPKEVLAANEDYMAVVKLTFNTNPRELKWWFKTGAQAQGLGRIK
ncbi:MAG: hypothetical protein O2865_05780 [Planctomycetota bacterium]|nr:hypothetical protein [Planctomycetota bacterium]MDA0932935.1 hypothetical protein [Planctomycetota bacterium]MDA1223117.1 hypothetical protein [Planctomycetota bacterium]